MALRQIRLELARNPDYPEGSANHGYDFVAPLTDDGHLDQDSWREQLARVHSAALLGRRG